MLVLSRRVGEEIVIDSDTALSKVEDAFVQTCRLLETAPDSERVYVQIAKKHLRMALCDLIALRCVRSASTCARSSAARNGYCCISHNRQRVEEIHDR